MSVCVCMSECLYMYVCMYFNLSVIQGRKQVSAGKHIFLKLNIVYEACTETGLEYDDWEATKFE